MMRWITTCLWVSVCVGVCVLRCYGEEALAVDYFEHKSAPYLCYFTCGYPKNTMVKDLMNKGIRVSMQLIDKHEALDLQRSLLQWNLPVGVLVDAGCPGSGALLEMASRAVLFDAMHMWLILESAVRYENTSEINSLDVLRGMNLSIDADVVIAVDTDRLQNTGIYLGVEQLVSNLHNHFGEEFELMDIFNFGKIQGNNLETKYIGTWSPLTGLNVSLSRFKYYDRWDFHNLTLRAISVILDRPKVFKPEMLSDLGYTVGVSVMTKIVTQLLWVLKDIHNFRFNYTIAGRWIGSPERNSTLAVTNSLYWGEQDISCTCARIFTQWLDWVDVFFPPATRLETKFYYLILDEGVGDYENRFLTPLSAGVWWCTIVASIICAIILAVTAVLEDREEPGLYASFSVFAVICQQAYEDGINLFEEISSSQGRRLILLVVGLMSMLLYNYYTSSVVSWLLNAAAPTLADMDALINSDLELVFEDIGYTRGWLDNPGFFYYSGYKNPKEDVLRMKKVTNAKRTTDLLQPAAAVSLIRSGQYAYHTEPYNAYQVISKTFEDKELCELGSLQMMAPAYVYIMAQKRSPYKQFFVWSLMRLLERGHTSAARARVSGYKPTCSGRTPRALALGQAAPAFAILALIAVVSVGILVCEIYYHRAQIKKRVQGFNNRAYNVQRRTDSRGT